MLAWIKNWFVGTPTPTPAPEKKIAFIDGDQNIGECLAAYDKYVANTGTETHFVKMCPANHNEPKLVRNRRELNRVYIEGAPGKEVVDKFIAGYIQRAVAEGYAHITVISNDYDFIDIFKMAIQINTRASEVTFRMIAPNPQGKLADSPEQIANIQITRMQHGK